MKRLLICFIVLTVIFALFSLTACSSADNVQKPEIELDKVTSENKTDNSSQNSESSSPPMENHMEFHSWEELKLLCDAAQRDSDKFLEALKMLNEQYCTQKKTHLYFDEISDKARYKNTFSNMYEGIKGEKIVILKEQKNNPGATQFGDISISSIGIRQPSVEVYSYVFYQCNFENKVFGLDAHDSGNYTNLMKSETGKSFIKIEGEGYSAEVWLWSDADNRFQSYHAYITEDGYSYPSFYVILSPSDFKGSPPEELLYLFGDLRITTIEEIFEDIDS